MQQASSYVSKTHQINDLGTSLDKESGYNAKLATGIDWGFYNHSLKKRALHIDEFYGVKNIIVPVHIQLDANREEIQLARPVIVIGSLEEGYRKGSIFTMGGKVMIFITFALPFLFSTILLIYF